MQKEHFQLSYAEASSSSSYSHQFPLGDSRLQTFSFDAALANAQ